MASAGNGGGDDRSNIGGGAGAKPNVADLLRKLHLTEVEEVIVDFSDEDEEEAPPLMEWAVVGKVLSPSAVHGSTDINLPLGWMNQQRGSRAMGMIGTVIKIRG